MPDLHTLLRAPDLHATVHHVAPGTVDPEAGELVPPGWHVTAVGDSSEPESVLLDLHVQFGVDVDGALIEEQLARALADQLNTGSGEGEPIHQHFGLTYANYLVLHRTLMQSMPLGWQRRMVACLDELHDAFRHVDRPDSFHVEAGVAAYVAELTPSQLNTLRITRELSDPDNEDSDWVWHDDAGTELDRNHRVVLPAPDPVPHYERGRARVEPWGGDRG
ncbi:hypothetical protein GCM10009613_60840 [Pseudonocardia kongjuensis]|uniref:Uncharacterized protein n=1 Tax=Pseudonocardia kongjuensis TaxID=102227 RepID=A0ABN1Y9Q4_9PSEU